MSHGMKKYPKRKFEEHEEPAKEAEATPEGEANESETPDSHEQFVNILVEMGLTAEQSEAVHSMAMDLVNAGQAPAQETETKEEMRKARFARRRSMSRGYGRPRRPRREMSEERPLRSRRGSSQGRRHMSENNRMSMMLRRQRQRIVELEQQLKEQGQTPGAQPLNNNRSQSFTRNTKPEIPTTGTPRDRVMKALEKFI